MKEFNYASEPGKYLKNRYDVSEIVRSEQIFISIITAYYNAGTYFEQTFYCVLNQTFPWFEWIIVNDGSTDQKDIEKLRCLTKADGRIKVIDQKNEGAVSARNRGIKNSRSKIIIFLDADDLIDCRYLEMVFWGLCCNKQVKWAYTDSVGFYKKQYVWKKEFSSEQMKKENILSYAAAIKKEVFTEGIYDNATKNHWEDWQFWLKLLAKGYQPFHINKCLFWYRRLNTGMLSRIENDKKLKKRLETDIKKLGKDVPDGIRAVCPDHKEGLEFGEVRYSKWDHPLPFKKRKIQILFLLPHMECGGADKFNLDIVKNLDKEKYAAGIVTTTAAQSEWEDQFAEIVDDVFELPLFLHKKDWVSFIYYYILSRKVDIICNISSYWGYYLLPLIRIDFPEIAVVDCVHAEGNYWRRGGYPRISGKLSSVIEKTFVTNDYTRNILAEKYGADLSKTQLIHTGVDADAFADEKISCSTEREMYQISADRPVVLYLCRMSPEKRPFLMLEIADQVRREMPDICFLAVGDGEYLDELKKKADAMNLNKNVVFTGRVKDTRPFYKMSDLLLLCSLKEGLSVTTFEALIMGMPVVSADVGSQYELVSWETGTRIPCRADEQADFYKRENDKEEVQEYADAVLSWICRLKKDRKTVQETCRNKIKNGYTLRDLIDTLELEFTKLVSKEAVIERIRTAKELSRCRGIFEELMILCNSYGSKEKEAEEIWRVNERWRQMIGELQENQQKKASLHKDDSLCGEELREERNRLYAELQRIYSLRTWKLVQKYHRFMEGTKMGKVLSRARSKFLT